MKKRPGAPFWGSLHPADAQLKTLISETAEFEIKELFHAHTGCTDRQNQAPSDLFICTFLYVSIHNLEYTCTCWVQDAKMCTPGAGCNLNKGFSRPRHLQGKVCKTGLCGQAWSFPPFDPM